MADRRALFGFAYLAALLLLAGAVYGTHILHGGFAWDDWQNAATARFGGGSRFLGPFDVREALYEPGLALTLPLPHLVFGLHPALHLALATALAVALSLCLYALLRELGVERVPAAFAGALALVFPWSDSVRLWATAGLNQVAVCLYLLGAMFALRGGRRLSLALYLASMLTYAVTIPAIALSPLLYRFRMPWREAWVRGRRDTLAALVTGAFVAAATTKPLQPLADSLRHAWRIVVQWSSIVARAVLPGAPKWVVLAGIAAVLVLAAARPSRLALLGVAASLVAYAAFGSAADKYSPLAPGVYNRVGVLAGPALAVAVVGLIAIVTELVPRRLRVAATSLLASLVLVGWAEHVRDDAAQWDRAAVEARATLAAFNGLARAKRVLVVDAPRYVAPGVPVFASSFDLANAVRVTRGNATADADPVFGPLPCPGETTPYVVVDVAGRSTLSVRSMRDCRRARGLFDLD